MTVQRYKIPQSPIYLSDSWNYQWKNWLYYLWTKVVKRRIYTLTITPTTIPANSTSEQTFTLNGLNSTDTVYINKPSHQTGLGVVNARVSADNTLAITWINCTSGSITPTTETYKVVAIQDD